MELNHLRTFREVVRERSFTGEGANLRAMAVDCLHQVLTHFWPERATPELRAEVKGFVRRVNESNVQLFRQVLDFAKGETSEEKQDTFIALLELSREALVEVTQAEAFAPIYVRLAYQPT
jgi:segregation and condensation protein A